MAFEAQSRCSLLQGDDSDSLSEAKMLAIQRREAFARELMLDGADLCLDGPRHIRRARLQRRGEHEMMRRLVPSTLLRMSSSDVPLKRDSRPAPCSHQSHTRACGAFEAAHFAAYHDMLKVAAP